VQKKILLIEDEPLIALSQVHILNKHGYRAVVSGDGESGIATAIEDPELALVLMDIDLGKGMDGTDAARRILEKRELPIVFFTNHTEKELVEKVRGITRYGYVLKNSGEFVLIQSIEMALQLFEAHSALKLENLERKRNEEKAAGRLEDITFLYEAAQQLVDISSSDELYAFITRQLSLLNPGAVIAVNSVHLEEGFCRTESIAGLGKLMTTIMSILGYNPIGETYTFDDSLFLLNEGQLVKFEHGIHELSFGKGPRPLSRNIESLLGIDSIYGIGFIADGKIFANSAIIFPRGCRLEKRRTVETFIRQAAIALRRQRSEEELRR
jgi:DNA-binding NarL/FixJ family response regulator